MNELFRFVMNNLIRLVQILILYLIFELALISADWNFMIKLYIRFDKNKGCFILQTVNASASHMSIFWTRIYNAFRVK